MSLPLLATLVVVGISLIVLAIHLTGGTRSAGLADETDALARFGRDFPSIATAAVHMTREGSDAFIELADGRVGLVHGFGDRFLTRVLAPADIASCRRRSEAGLLLRLKDFTYGGGAFEFADGAVADRVAALLAGEPVGKPETA